MAARSRRRDQSPRIGQVRSRSLGDLPQMVGEKSAKSRDQVLSHQSDVRQPLVSRETLYVPPIRSSVMNKFLLAGMVLTLGATSPSFAGSIAFSGDFSNRNAPAAPGGRCTALTVNIGNGPPPFFAAGTSSVGAFTAAQSHCLDSGPPILPGAADVPYYDGLFTFTFSDGKTLSGIYDGLLSNSG